MQASRDGNNVPTLLGALETDGTTLIRVKANASTHALQTSEGTTGTDYGPANAPRDENNIPALMGVSSVDGVTPVVIYANSDGQLLVKST